MRTSETDGSIEDYIITFNRWCQRHQYYPIGPSYRTGTQFLQNFMLDVFICSTAGLDYSVQAIGSVNYIS